MLIEVTQEDIDNGVRGDSRLCPTVLALNRCGIRRRLFVRDMPAVVQEFVSKYDAGLPVAPFAFDLDL